MRDHLFISYATEDELFARWLALRLTSFGYKVWIDQFELLGGERYPSEIDTAIKTRTFRLLALLSKHSIAKPNPTKERTLALNLARERGEDFLIPLNLDGLRPTELDWMTSDLTFIPFNENWADGLGQLLALLQRDEAPLLSDGVGPRAARQAIHSQTAVVEVPEILGSNLFPIIDWPEVLHQFRLTREVTEQDVLEMSDRWAFHYSPAADSRSRQFVFGFEEPPDRAFGNATAIREVSAVWESTEELHGIPCWNLVKPITVRSAYLKCRSLGLQESSDGSFVYFPDGLLESNRLGYVSYKGRRVSLQVVGERSFRGDERFRYHLGFWLDVLHLPGGRPVLKLGIRLRLTDLNGRALPTATALARRKSITRMWFNHEFYSRTLAIASFLADSDGRIRFGLSNQIVASGTPLQLGAPVSIDEDMLKKGRQPYRSGSGRSDEDLD